MDRELHNIWQISPPVVLVSSIADFFIQHGVVLLWPGDSGRWDPDRYQHNFAESDWIKWFAETMSEGDAIILRVAPSKIRALGLVVGDYSYEDRFDDVHGFDLQHCRRVRWCRLPQDYDFGEQVFTKGRFSAVRKELVHDYVRDFLASPPTQWKEAALPKLPPEEITLENVPTAMQSLVAQALDTVPQYFDRMNFGDHPTEDELLCHFIVPLLKALGWPAEQIAVKWRYVDVAVFGSLPREPENCQFIIEAKRLGTGVEDALKQAIGYVRSLGTKSDVIITDGIRYRMYSAEDDFKHVASANLLRLKKSAENLFKRLRRH